MTQTQTCTGFMTTVVITALLIGSLFLGRRAQRSAITGSRLAKVWNFST